MLSFILCFIAILGCVNSELIAGPVVDTIVGRISGIVRQDMMMFLGIPYGVVDERDPFAAATPTSKFNTTFLAHKDPIICPQLVKDVPKGSIHCLNLNIYTPNNITADSSLPVMIFIHGGAFVGGDGNFNSLSPTFLVKNNVIIITINYRLGVYGFICIPKLNYSNQGLKDQVLAFEWVKNNIKYFGGNNNNITIFGHSTGSVSADLHLLFNEEKLFNKVILQSGLAASPIAINNSANEHYARNVAKKLGFKSRHQNVGDIMKELSNIDTNMLINMTSRDIYRPCIDEVYIRNTVNANLKGIKIMVGATTREGVSFYDNNGPAEQFCNYLPNESIRKVKEYYFKSSNIIDDAMEFGTDFMFAYPIERSIKYYEGNADAVYKYVFSYDGKRNLLKVRDNITVSGAIHADELGYLFDVDFLGTQITLEDQVVIDNMTKWWTNFAKYGNPDESWPPVDKVTKYYKEIGATISTEKNFFKDKVEFWDKLYSMYGESIFGINFGE